MSFFQYTNTKSGNKNYKEEKYDKPGPYFYTGENKQITFVNCPLFSSRKIEMEHPLPPIPFMPKIAQVKTQDKMFWVSHQQLDYKSQAMSYGNDMMESIVTHNLYKVKQTQGQVSVDIYCKVVFVKEPRMKSMILNGALAQLKNVVPAILGDIDKAVKNYLRQRDKSAGINGEANADEGKEEEEELLKVNAKEEKDGGLITPKFLIIFAIGTILINLLIHLLF